METPSRARLIVFGVGIVSGRQITNRSTFLHKPPPPPESKLSLHEAVGSGAHHNWPVVVVVVDVDSVARDGAEKKHRNAIK